MQMNLSMHCLQSMKVKRNKAMKVVLASHNKHKIAELQRLLSVWLPSVEVLSLTDVGLFGEIEENGDSFEANALIKASFAARSGYIGIGDDSGLCVEALGGAPGIYSARFAGKDGDNEANNKKLLEELKGEPCRRAKFVCTVACVFPDGAEPLTVTGETEGEILCEPRGDGGFGYDPLFWFDPDGKTFAEMDSDEKNAVSHRGKAIKQLADELLKKQESAIQ